MHKICVKIEIMLLLPLINLSTNAQTSTQLTNLQIFIK